MTDKEIMINCSNNNLKSYILNLQHERDKYKQALDEIEDVADDYNRVEKTSQYYRDGFDEIQDIINGIKEQIMEYDVTHYNKILPQDRETLVALIKFLFDYIEELEGDIK